MALAAYLSPDRAVLWKSGRLEVKWRFEERNMAVTVEKVASCDPIWSALREQAEKLATREPALASFVHATILKHTRLEDALSYHLAKKIGGEDLSPMLAREMFEEAITADPEIGSRGTRRSFGGVRTRSRLPFLCRGVSFLQGLPCAGMLSHRPLAVDAGSRSAWRLFFQSRISELFDVDIHPAALLGRGIMIDHATGVVIGETAVVEDDVSMLHGVTLGGTGKESGDRHPKIRRGVLLSMGAKVLGNIEIGEYSRVGAGSVVLEIGTAALHRRRRAGEGRELPRLRTGRRRKWTS